MDEEYDTDPMDSYGLSKVCGEKIARTFARRFNADIYALRIGNVITPDDYATRFPEFIKNPMSRKRCSWSYVDARDLGQICHLCSTKDGLGFQVFNATNDTITSTIPTAKFLKQFQPETPHSRELEEFEAPMTNRKIRQVLGFQEQHNWRKYVKVD
jgi:nucleoside-diphosphate-sugar epimerase